MKLTTLFDLYVAACVEAADTQLANRFDSAQDRIESSASYKRHVVGLIVRCANSGYLKIVQDSRVIFTAALCGLNAQTQIVPVDIDVPVGSPVYVYARSTSGTAYCAVLVLLTEESA